MKLSKNPIVNILFFIALLGGVIAFVYLWYASEKRAKVKEPYLLAYSKEYGVIFNIEDTLYHTEIDGRYIASYSFETLGLEDTLGDIVVTKDALLVTQGRSHTVLRCPFPLRECKKIADVKGLKGVEALDIAVTPDEKHFYITSSGAHKIDYYSIDGHHLYELLLDEKLNYPNGIVSLGEGKLVVADTNNHRIIGVNHKDSNAKVMWELPVKSILTREGFVWPTALAVANDGFLWVVNLDGFFEEGDVIIYEQLPLSFDTQVSDTISDASTFVNDNVARFTLPEHSRPNKLQTIENGMLIIDAQNFKIIETCFSGLSYKEFGDITIQNALATLHLEKVFWDNQVVVAQILLGLFLLMLIAAGVIEYITAENKEELFSKSENKSYDATDIEFTKEQEITPDKEGVIWLYIKPDVIKKFKLLVKALGILSVALIAIVINLKIYDTNFLAAIAFLFLIIIGSAFFALRMVTKQRIGVKEGRIYIVDVFGNHVDDDASNVTYTGQRILVKEKAISVHDGNGKPLFDEIQFAHYILPLLGEENSVNEFQVLFYKLKHGDLKTWLGMIAFIITFGVIIWFEFYGK